MNRLKTVDHGLYKKYRDQKEREHFMQSFIEWYENGGVRDSSYKKRLQDLLRNLCKNGHSMEDIASRTNLVSMVTLKDHRYSYKIGERKSKIIYSHLKEVFA